LSLAYDLENLKVLCYHHHINWWHKHPTESGQWFRERYPREMEYLERMKPLRRARPIKDFELEEIYDKLKLTIDTTNMS
jgi:hypothetical protein